MSFSFFFFNDTATTEIYTLSLHDALPISYFDSVALMRVAEQARQIPGVIEVALVMGTPANRATLTDRKSTRLNSSHGYISYAVFCLKKKKKKKHKMCYNYMIMS